MSSDADASWTAGELDRLNDHIEELQREIVDLHAEIDGLERELSSISRAYDDDVS